MIFARKASQSALALILAASLSACATTGTNAPKTKLDTQAKATPEQAKAAEADVKSLIKDDPIAAAAYWGSIYDSNNKDAAAAANYGDALRQIGSNEKAAQILHQALDLNPQDPKLLAAYGKSIAASGQPGDAVSYLERAATLDPKNSQTLSAAGVVQDQLGHPDEARKHYEAALLLKPDDPVILNNYGLSRAFAGDLPKAENLLRHATATPGSSAQMRQNLALVLGLAGKFDEAESLSRGDLPVRDVEKNMDYIRMLIGQPVRSKELGTLIGAPDATAATQPSSEN